MTLEELEARSRELDRLELGWKRIARWGTPLIVWTLVVNVGGPFVVSPSLCAAALVLPTLVFVVAVTRSHLRLERYLHRRR